MRIAASDPCPCGAGLSYKKCCRKYHNGPPAPTAEALMRSRYSAYALGLSSHIRETTHPDGPHYQPDRAAWDREILDFCIGTDFEKLEVIEVREGESEGFVSFYLTVNRAGRRARSGEKSRFLKEGGRWLYHSGETFKAVAVD
jgi:SEC-C motif-containing protein